MTLDIVLSVTVTSDKRIREWRDDMPEIDYYKLAPTWLYKNGNGKLFETQEAVDAAWEDGWGPPGKPKPVLPPDERPLLSLTTYRKKVDMENAVMSDSRYDELELPEGKTLDEMLMALLEYEVDNEIGG